MSQYNNHWRLTNHKVAFWCIMQIFKCGICVLADGCISMSYLNILVSLRVFVWICRHTHASRPGVVFNFAAVFIVMSSIHFLSRWQCLFRDFTCVRLLLYWLTVWLSCCVQHYYRCNCFDCLHHATSWQHFELQRPCLTVALSSINLSHSLAVCLSLALYFSSMASHCLMGNVH